MKHPWSPRQFDAQAKALGRSEGTVQAALDVARAIKNSHPDLPVIFTLSHLAHLTDIPPKIVRNYVVQRGSAAYRTFRLKKRNKSKSKTPSRAYRTISVPAPNLMRLQRWINENILSVITPHIASFAYHHSGGILDAARVHCRCKWLVKMDIREFFDSILENKVYHLFRNLGYTPLLSWQESVLDYLIGRG